MCVGEGGKGGSALTLPWGNLQSLSYSTGTVYSYSYCTTVVPPLLFLPLYHFAPFLFLVAFTLGIREEEERGEKVGTTFENKWDTIPKLLRVV